MHIKSIFLKLFLTCLIALVLSHVVLAVVFAVLFQHSLASIPLTSAALNQMKQLFSVASFISLAMTSVFFSYLSRRITAPLREMNRVALQIARGHFDQRGTIKTRNEVRALGETFNDMAAWVAAPVERGKDFVGNCSPESRL